MSSPAFIERDGYFQHEHEQMVPPGTPVSPDELRRLQSHHPDPTHPGYTGISPDTYIAPDFNKPGLKGIQGRIIDVDLPSDFEATGESSRKARMSAVNLDVTPGRLWRQFDREARSTTRSRLPDKVGEYAVINYDPHSSRHRIAHHASVISPLSELPIIVGTHINENVLQQMVSFGLPLPLVMKEARSVLLQGWPFRTRQADLETKPIEFSRIETINLQEFIEAVNIKGKRAQGIPPKDSKEERLAELVPEHKFTNILARMVRYGLNDLTDNKRSISGLGRSEEVKRRVLYGYAAARLMHRLMEGAERGWNLIGTMGVYDAADRLDTLGPTIAKGQNLSTDEKRRKFLEELHGTFWFAPNMKFPLHVRYDEKIQPAKGEVIVPPDVPLIHGFGNPIDNPQEVVAGMQDVLAALNGEEFLNRPFPIPGVITDFIVPLPDPNHNVAVMALRVNDTFGKLAQHLDIHSLPSNSYFYSSDMPEAAVLHPWLTDVLNPSYIPNNWAQGHRNPLGLYALIGDNQETGRPEVMDLIGSAHSFSFLQGEHSRIRRPDMGFAKHPMRGNTDSATLPARIRRRTRSDPTHLPVTTHLPVIPADPTGQKQPVVVGSVEKNGRVIFKEHKKSKTPNGSSLAEPVITVPAPRVPKRM